MIIVLDVNPLLAALIRDSTSRKIIANSTFEFCFPEAALHKIRKYQNYIIKKSGLSELEYLVILHSLLKLIRIIPTEEIMPFWEEANSIMGSIDPEDVTFVATALSQGGSFIWSDDKDFDEQDTLKVLKTKEILGLIEPNGSWFIE